MVGLGGLRAAGRRSSPAGSGSDGAGARLVIGQRCCCSTSPSSNLDRRLRKRCTCELKTHPAGTAGITTILYVTHDQEEALTLATGWP